VNARSILRPRVHACVPTGWLAAAAVLCMAAWLAVERAMLGPVHPRFADMLMAARAMQAASGVLFSAKTARGLMPQPEADPNRTGMIGPEYTAVTTTLGDLPSKRTTTNPDFAAVLVRLLASLELRRGTPVAIVVSGSFVGGNVAAISAAEALGLRPVVVASLSASMWGATDPEFNWLDMAALLRERGVIRARTTAAVLGGTGAVGGSMDPEGVAALRTSAVRDGVPLVEARPFAAVVEGLLGHVNESIGPGARPGAVINVGGALTGLGSCRESYEFLPGLTRRPPTCTGGTAGVAMRLALEGVPLLHVLNMRRFALENGLPFDPVPLPSPGDNAAVYGVARGGQQR
jgi:poly-gamma-glutamate system protein